MRALALALVLANLGFLGWSQWVDVQSEDRYLPTGAAPAQRLVLATETPAALIAPPDDTTVAAESGAESSEPALAVESDPGPFASGPIVADADLRCISIGTFRDLAAAVQASAALQTAGFFSRQRVAEGEVWLGHWVSLSGVATREEAQTILDALIAAGIGDVYLLPGGDPGALVISLGVFTDTSRAQQRAEEVRKLGFEPRISDRTRPGSVYWIDVDLGAAGTQFDPAILQSEPGRIVRLDFRRCPQENGVTPN